MRTAIVDDYPHAVIRLATHYDREAEAEVKARLIFASVELVPHGMPPPRTSAIEMLGVSGSSSISVFYREVAVTTAEALRWYRSGANNLITPIPKDIERTQADGGPLVVSELLDEPVWPHLALPFQDVFEASHDFENELPFLAQWQSCPRYHRRLGRRDEVLEGALAHKRVGDWLHRRLFVDLVQYSEFLGGMVLAAPNPVLAQVDKVLVPLSDNSAAESLVLHLEPRPSQDVSGLEVTVSIARNGGLIQRETRRVGIDPYLKFQTPMDVRASGYTIQCPNRGVLYHQPVLPIFRSFHGLYSIGGGRVEIVAPTRRGKGVDNEKRNLTRYGRGEEFGLADRVVLDKRLQEMSAAAGRRARKRQAEAFDQHWFKHRDEARAFFREKIARAQDRVWLCDPYLADLELLWFAHDTKIGVEIVILTSREAGFDDDLHALGSMAFQLRQLQEKRPEGSVRAHVMRGRPPPLHDRFLVCDQTVWMVGNSFGTVGERAGVVVRLPDHEEPITNLSELISGAEDFRSYAQRRAQAIKKARSSCNLVSASKPKPRPHKRGPYRRRR